MDVHSQNTPNKLSDSNSPYLKQHAYNPVNWYPWGKEALDISKNENKPILLSIGYSSCHWCHVMAHESFEDEEIASYMNNHFINIKLDREERPDIDQIYMDAIQNMGLRGGWPLNVFLTPDQKPFYGGTYFPPQNWLKLLNSISDAYSNNYEKLAESSEQFSKSLVDDYTEKYGLGKDVQNLKIEDFVESVQSSAPNFDTDWGGFNKSPKFPMPAVWNNLFHLNYYQPSPNLMTQLLFTLDKIAAGGIYDQIGGGFSRYSVDAEWHVPHFEKMLYDNGQLMSLYSIAYKETKNDQYKKILVETAQWLLREMTNDNGGFFAALDADSEGEEGKFYVWSYDDILEIAQEDAPLITLYYDVSKEGNWEDKNVLRRLYSDQEIAEKYNLSKDQLYSKVQQFKEISLKTRDLRIRPGLDDKIISGWNGLMLSGLLNAYQATNESIFREISNKNAQYILTFLISENKLLRTYGSEIEGFLEDYAAVIQAFIIYYETFADETYLLKANELVKHVINAFHDKEDSLFFYSSNDSESLIARKKELFDNVIPSSNALMAENLYKLGSLLYNEEYKSISKKMIDQVSHLILKEPEYMSYWSTVAINQTIPTAEVMIIGDKFRQFQDALNSHFLPAKICMATKTSSQLELFEHKDPIGNKTTVYLCYDKTCQRPVFTEIDMLELIQN